MNTYFNILCALLLCLSGLMSNPAQASPDDLQDTLLIALDDEAEGEDRDGTSLDENSGEATAESVQSSDLNLASSATATTAGDRGRFVVGLHIGPHLPVFSDLGVFVLPKLELGYILPFMGGRWQPFVTLAYTAPSLEGEIPDTRLPNSGSFTYEVNQREFIICLGVLFRIFELGATWNGYAALGPAIFLLETIATGEAGGEPFGENRASGTEIGFTSALGAELMLGPGAAFFELSLTWSKLDTLITGESSTGALSPTVGYRFMF